MTTLIITLWAVSVPLRLYTAWRLLATFRYHLLTLWLTGTALHSLWALATGARDRLGILAPLYFVLTLSAFWALIRHFSRTSPLAWVLLGVFGSFSLTATAAASTLLAPYSALESAARHLALRNYTAGCFVFLCATVVLCWWLESDDDVVPANDRAYVLGMVILLWGQTVTTLLVRFDVDLAFVAALIQQVSTFAAYAVWMRIHPEGETGGGIPPGRWDLTMAASRRAFRAVRDAAGR